MFKLNLLFLVVCLSINSLCYSQQAVHAELEINFATKSEDDSVTMYNFKTLVKETIHFKSHQQDSVKLTIENMRIPFPTFFYNNIRVSASWEDHEVVDLPYVFEYDTLRFAIPNPDCKIVLNYDYQSDFVIRCGMEVVYLVSYIYDWTSWYLTCEDIKVKHIQFNVPDNQYFFANLPMSKEGSSVVLLPEKIKENNITYFLLAKDFYNFSAFKYKDVDLELYQTRGAVPRYDLKKIVPGVNSLSYLKKREDMAKNAVKSVVDFLQCDFPMKVSIADKRLSQRENVIWGSTTHISEQEAFVLIDSTMWHDDGLYHELVHAFTQHLLSNVPESDSTHYFFSESIVCYIAMYLKYENEKERDKIFDSMILTYSKSKELNSSIFHITENHLNGRDDTGGSYVINQKTPFVIHSFARRIGEKRFIEIFKDFYRQAKVTKQVSMADFESVAKRHGVTDKEWRWFMKYL